MFSNYCCLQRLHTATAIHDENFSVHKIEWIVNIRIFVEEDIKLVKIKIYNGENGFFYFLKCVLFHNISFIWSEQADQDKISDTRRKESKNVGKIQKRRKHNLFYFTPFICENLLTFYAKLGSQNEITKTKMYLIFLIPYVNVRS